MANSPPRIFRGNGTGLVDIVQPNPDAPLMARELKPSALRRVFSNAANWYDLKTVDGGEVQVDDFPPHALLTSFPERGEWPWLPFLRSIVPYPVFAPGWRLVAEQGYDQGSGLFCDLGKLVLPSIPSHTVLR